MIEERFESYVYQIMQYVKYQENKPYIESILEEMRYTLFREDRNYIKQLEQENKQLKEEIEKKNKKYWQQQCACYSSILYSLEEWLNSKYEKGKELLCDDIRMKTVLDKIQELKEKYK